MLPNPHIQQTPSQNQQQSVATQNVNQVDVTTGQTAEALSENVDANAFTVLQNNVVNSGSGDEVVDQIVDTVLSPGANVSNVSNVSIAPHRHRDKIDLQI